MLASERVTWMERGICRTEHVPVDVFFPGEKGEPNYATNLRRAKRTCSRCTVRPECLEYAIRTGMRGGVWGGETEYGRDQIAERRGITVHAA